LKATLLAISDRRQLAGGDLGGWLEELAAARVGAVQLREKDLGGKELLALALAAREHLTGAGLLLINSRVDVAISAGAAGVHLPASGLPIVDLRRRFGDDLVIGRSTHTLGEVAAAAAAGADYVTFGPVYETPSKLRYGPPRGLSELRRAAAVGLPVYALGGVTIERLAEVADAGASGAAGIRIFLDPGRLPELTAAARSLFP
jgi:thiamine-phosphate pyrophosphorylase